MKPDRVCTVIMACAVLQNIAIERREPEAEEELELLELEDGDDFYQGAEHDGVNARDNMAQTYFT